MEECTSSSLPLPFLTFLIFSTFHAPVSERYHKFEADWQVRSDHDALTRSLLDTNNLLSNSELSIVLSSLLATHAMTQAYDHHKALDDRKVALGMEISEVGRILMNEGDEWRKALAGT